MVLGEIETLVRPDRPAVRHGGGQRREDGSRAEERQAQAPRPRAGGSATTWLSAQDVALLLLRGECLEAGVEPPARYSPPAVISAVGSVERWTREGRIFAVQGRYPAYQFDERGRPFTLIERALQVFGRADPMRVGNWFAFPNAYLGGRRPHELLAAAPRNVELALQRAAALVAR